MVWRDAGVEAEEKMRAMHINHASRREARRAHVQAEADAEASKAAADATCVIRVVDGYIEAEATLKEIMT